MLKRGEEEEEEKSNSVAALEPSSLRGQCTWSESGEDQGAIRLMQCNLRATVRLSSYQQTSEQLCAAHKSTLVSIHHLKVNLKKFFFEDLLQFEKGSSCEHEEKHSLL